MLDCHQQFDDDTVYRGVSAHPVAAAPPMAVTDGETDRVARLFDTHQDMLYRLARRLTESADSARDPSCLMTHFAQTSRFTPSTLGR
jgi:hypothetical protein